MATKLTFIIPGFRQKTTSKAYKNVAKVLKKAGHTPIAIKIPWNQSTISENTAYFLKEYKRKLLLKKKTVKREKRYILGFSFGAMIAFIAATKVRVDGLILCSLSPYFKEDLPKTKQRGSSALETSRYQDFSKHSSNSLTKQIKTKKILMLYGTKESTKLIKRVTKAYKQISSTQKKLVPITKTEHNIGTPKYLRTISHVANNFL